MRAGRRNLWIAISAIVLAGAVGGGVAIATGALDDDRPLTGSSLQRAKAAALEHVGGGAVVETEVGDDGAAYGVEVRLEGGRTVEVSLDADLRVIGTEDDDGSRDAGSPEDD